VRYCTLALSSMQDHIAIIAASSLNPEVIARSIGERPVGQRGMDKRKRQRAR
jgi:hypothetical protein